MSPTLLISAKKDGKDLPWGTKEISFPCWSVNNLEAEKILDCGEEYACGYKSKDIKKSIERYKEWINSTTDQKTASKHIASLDKWITKMEKEGCTIIMEGF